MQRQVRQQRVIPADIVDEGFDWGAGRRLDADLVAVQPVRTRGFNPVVVGPLIHVDAAVRTGIPRPEIDCVLDLRTRRGCAGNDGRDRGIRAIRSEWRQDDVGHSHLALVTVGGSGMRNAVALGTGHEEGCLVQDQGGVAGGDELVAGGAFLLQVQLQPAAEGAGDCNGDIGGEHGCRRGDRYVRHVIHRQRVGRAVLRDRRGGISPNNAFAAVGQLPNRH